MQTWWDCVSRGIQIFGLSDEDAQDKEQWSLRIKGELANLSIPEKWSLKWCVHAS